MINKGEYRARPLRSKLSETSKGLPTVAIEFELSSGPDTGSLIVGWLNFTDLSWERSVQSLRACGWKGNDIERVEVDPSSEVRLTIVHERNPEGAMRAKVAWINPPFTPKPMNEVAAGEFSQWLKGEMKAKGLTPSTSTDPELDYDGPDTRVGGL